MDNCERLTPRPPPKKAKEKNEGGPYLTNLGPRRTFFKQRGIPLELGI